MYLIDKLPTSYDGNLFQFIFNLIEVICLVQEARKFLIGWLKMTTRISKNNKRELE